ncbi:4Fe-4S binding protein [Pontibacter sp. BT310]|uniref:4Fe-4S binding protein n=1 Tax=Pontibacter populi TaxID=890055 RepID=A0ABS6XAA7_9BACT|nr:MULTISPECIES: 4Fe-4S binding protein [Pontibacter]MBJ6118041.1 4Fe-4S binding protein [Pontibacter sp. BT310]MBR0570468.1 4Fe-4S binding protein [Microvirga sp. STS03]MBW3364894.1 4Fe-4S binding protein [Pontibacter populi]
MYITSDNTLYSYFKHIGFTLLAISLLCLLITLTGGGNINAVTWGLSGISLLTIGSLLVIISSRLPKHVSHQNNGIWQKDATTRGISAWVLGIVLTGFYILLYWFPDTLHGLIAALEPLSQWLRNKPSDQWFLYGFFYTLAVIVMGVHALLKYRNNPYHLIRTCSVIFFQLGFAFLLPGLLLAFNQPEFYFSYFWPLKYDYLFPGTVGYLIDNGQALGVFMVFWGAVLSFLATPVLTYFYGKRWYCSWVCGCGGLAETAGDPYRHLSDKSKKAWQWEVAIIYPILGFVIITTLLLWINSWSGGSLLGDLSGGFSRSYGFFIGSIFSGVVGVGFYPILGNRVWCRFGCPMAAYLGLLQKHLSRFRITTNGGQCISCGNCSTYCEMGIDVRWYAQQGKPIIRSSCVGCGICAHVCPRGVLKLENGPVDGRYNGSSLIQSDSLKILS